VSELDDDDDPASTAWAFEMIDRIQRGARIGRETAARRPRRAELADSLRLWTALVSARVAAEIGAPPGQAGDGDNVLGPFSEHAWRPSSRSAAAAERQQLLELGWPESFLSPGETDDYDHVCLYVRRIEEGLLDHLRALCRLLDDDRSTRSMLVLGRVVLDGSAHVKHLTDPNVGAVERLLRALNYELGLLGIAYQDAVESGNVEDVAAFDGRLEEINRIVGPRVGQQVAWRDRSRGAPRIGNPRRGEIIKTALEGSASAFRTFSAAVHMQEDAGFRFLTGVGPWNDPHGQSRVILYLLHGLAPVVQAQELIARHLGWDFSPVDAATPDLLARWADGAGLNDAEIRRQILDEWGEPDPNATLPPQPPAADDT
jgi:hypothetical protein